MRGGPAIGIGGLVLVLAISYFTGQDPRALLQLLSTASEQAAPAESTGSAPPPRDQPGTFTRIVLADTEETWKAIFAGAGQSYEEPPLVLFTEAVRSGCGTASSAMGPFYCPADHKVYLDPVFFDQL